jgi:hypothetical protein
MKTQFNTDYTGEYTSQIGFPMGGIGAGMICLAGNGMLTSVSIDNRPLLFCEPNIFAALSVGGCSRVIEGPVPWHKIFGTTPGAGNGLAGKNYGLPRFRDCSFASRFPFGTVTLTDNDVPLSVSLTGWSPFIPSCADDSSLPAAALEYTFENNTGDTIDAVFSYHAAHEILPYPVRGERRIFKSTQGGFIVENLLPEGSDGVKRWFAVTTDAAEASVIWVRDGGDALPRTCARANPRVPDASARPRSVSDEPLGTARRAPASPRDDEPPPGLRSDGLPATPACGGRVSGGLTRREVRAGTGRDRVRDAGSARPRGASLSGPG